MASQNILISLEPRHAENILSGKKSFELRRRRIHVEPGAVVWMYAKLPEAQVVGFATVAHLHVASPSSLWRRFGKDVGLSKREFFDYFAESQSGFALELGSTTRLKIPVTLKALRKVDSAFQPPQFFKRLSSDAHVLRAMSTELSEVAA